LFVFHIPHTNVFQSPQLPPSTRPR
jgi:hypothetical protein